MCLPMSTTQTETLTTLPAEGNFVVRADEIVFESKGMPNCNRSISFNANINRGGHMDEK
jgi:hypothetical protein